MGICTLLSGSITAGVIGACLQPVVVRLLIRGSVLDIPNARSSHTVPTPRGGGIAIVVAIACALMLDGTTRTFVVPLLLFAGVGLLEDLRGASIAVRLSLQCGSGAVAAAVMVLHPSPAWFLLVVFWLVGYANVFNFMDGLNGMSAGHAILAGGVYATVGWIDGVPVLTTVGTVTAVAAATFLPWNAGRARCPAGGHGGVRADRRSRCRGGRGPARSLPHRCRIYPGTPDAPSRTVVRATPIARFPAPDRRGLVTPGRHRRHRRRRRARQRRWPGRGAGGVTRPPGPRRRRDSAAHRLHGSTWRTRPSPGRHFIAECRERCRRHQEGKTS
jgi:hypothetical protein